VVVMMMMIMMMMTTTITATTTKTIILNVSIEMCSTKCNVVYVLEIMGNDTDN